MVYGKYFTNKKILEIPAGIKNGAYIKCTGKGNAEIRDVPNGDMYI